MGEKLSIENVGTTVVGRHSFGWRGIAPDDWVAQMALSTVDVRPQRRRQERTDRTDGGCSRIALSVQYKGPATCHSWLMAFGNIHNTGEWTFGDQTGYDYGQRVDPIAMNLKRRPWVHL